MAGSLQTARALVAITLAICVPLIAIASDLHVELQGYCDSADGYMRYADASCMEANSSAGSVPLLGSGFIALIDSNVRDHAFGRLVAVLDDGYRCREHDGVATLVDRPG